MVADGMRRLFVTSLTFALLSPATASAAPVRVDHHRAADGVRFTLTVAQALDGADRARFAFTERAADGDTGRIAVPAVGLATRRPLLVGTGIGCGPPAATAVYGTVRASARRVVATTTDGDAYRLRRVRAPERWKYGGWVVGRVMGGPQEVERVEAFNRRGKRMASAQFGAPATCPAG